MKRIVYQALTGVSALSLGACATVGGGAPNSASSGPAASQEPATSLADPSTAPELVSADGPDLPQPQVLRAEDGVLKVTMTAAPSQVTVAGQTFTSNVFNGSYIAPVLMLDPGDRLEFTLVNMIGPSDNAIDAPQPTNTHYHGMNISPLEPGDNIYLVIPSGAPEPEGHYHDKMGGMDMTPSVSLYRDGNSYRYTWTVPMDHSLGLHWYHPHVHGHVEDQILSGLSGSLVIGDLVRRHYPEFAALERRRLIFRDIDLPDAPDGAPKTKTINGMLGGVVRTSPGDMEIWELSNLGADSFVDFAIDGHRFWVLGRDGNTLERPEQTESVFLPPAARATVIVEGGNAGVYGMRTLEVDNGPMGDPNPEVLLGSFVVDGPVSDSTALRPHLLEPAADAPAIIRTAKGVKDLPVTRRRTITYTESADGKSFYINGREFDMTRNDIEVTLGDVEEWTIVNDTDERHTFHIHQTDFLVLDINGDDEDAIGLRDVIDVPPRQDGKPGTVTVKIPFTNPLMVGRFPFHCHIVEHEDGGMMGNILLKPAP